MMQSENAEPLSQECLTLLRDIDRGHTALPATDRARRKHGRALDALLRRGLVMSGRNGGLAISARGKRLLRLGQADEYGSARHGVVTSEDVHVAGLRQQVRRNRAESPLSWLRHRQKTGSRLGEEHELDAGERLREDFTLAALTPRITMNWNASVPQAGRSGRGGSAEMTEAMVAARMRVQRALDAVGPEFSGVLLDVCCFLKGLEEIEQGRSWPSRSAKIVLALGLKALARHYGLDQTALPPARPRMRHWGAPDYRPRISEGDAG